ncbi:N-acetylmuramoyl-L-alanine amidase, partial [Blastococcus sp. LR1]|uniref:N-acetylmuramoyl-L-alanine amidase n=1 Tax=Blastococcus sp. LR1 TaxID=2877000 RepID=UPI001CCCDB58
MRRLLIGLSAFLTLTGTILVVPVSAAPGPEAHPVTASADLVPMGSAEDPARGAELQEGTTEPVVGVPESAPALTVSRTDVEFSMVGVTWAPDPAVDDTVVAIRVQDEDGAWGDWSEVEVEDMEPDAGDGAPATERRGGTAPLWTGPSTGVEAELVTRSGAAPTDVQLDLIDPGTSAADGALGEPAMGDVAHAAMTMPAVYTRAQWGADERIRSWGPQYPPTIKAATIHHTANSNNYTEAQVPGILRGIYQYHAVSLGWGDIGYNVIADRYGNLYEGRFGGLASTVVGAHAGGFNTGTVGVSMLGDYSTVAVPQAQIDAVSRIVAWKFSLFGINPRGTTSLVGGGSTSKYKVGSTVTLPTVFAHRDVGNTACPGNSGYARMPEIRDRVAALMAGQVAAEPTMAARYASDPALRSQLGAPIQPEATIAGVTYRRYERGNMYWTPTTGAHAVVGDILARYLAGGGPAALGAPTTDELATPDRVGRFSVFTGGTAFPGGVSIYWTPRTGPRAVAGVIRDLWASQGYETGPLGYPTADEKATPDGKGRYSEFERGVITWTPAGGARSISGDVVAKWRSL